MTRLISHLPETTNGLDAISDDILANPRAERIVVAIVDCPKAHDDFDNGRRIPYMRIRAIEALTSGAADHARGLLEDAYTKRTGQDSLTLDAIATTAETGKPCPEWMAPRDDEEDAQPCVYEDGHPLPHKLRDGTEFDADGKVVDSVDDPVQPAFQEATDDD